MKIASVIFMFHPYYGGAEVQAHLLAQQFQQFGHDVTVLTMHFGSTAEREVWDGVRVVRLPKEAVQKGNVFGILRAMVAAFRELRRLRPDAVHLHGVPFLLIPVIAIKKVLGVPVVVKMISTGVSSKSTILMTHRFRWTNWFKRTLLKQVDCFVCLNQELSNEIKTLAPGAYCVSIPNGIDCSRWNPPKEKCYYKAALGIEGYHTSIFVGRFVPEKGVDVLLKVWKKVQERDSKAKLFLVGDGPLLADMRRLADDLGIAPTCEFVGAKKDIREVLFAMDAFLLFSPNEGMSNAMLEAMSAGVPVICSDNPGTAGVIQHMVNGIRVPRTNISEAAEHIDRVFEDPELAAALSSRARSDAQSRFDIRVTARQYEELFRRFTTGKVDASRDAAS